MDVGFHAATLAQGAVRFRSWAEQPSPIPASDAWKQVGVADLASRRAMYSDQADAEAGRLARLLFRFLSGFRRDVVWQGDTEYFGIDDGQRWTTFDDVAFEVTPWPLWPFDLLLGTVSADIGNDEHHDLRHLRLRVDPLLASHREPSLLLPGPIRPASLADTQAEAWMDSEQLVHRVSVSLTGGSHWHTCELFDHGTAAQIPSIDPALVVPLSDVNNWRRAPRRTAHRGQSEAQVR